METERLCITISTVKEMEQFIKKQTDAEMIQAYTEMLEGSINHPDEYEWYAIWMITLKNGTYVGDLCFKGLNANGMVEIGYGLSEEYWGLGYATEAVNAAVEWALTRPGVRCVEAETEPDNSKSQRVLEKCGFEPNGIIGEEGPRFVCHKRKAGIYSYVNGNTDIDIQDIFKYLFQSVFGCEHLVSDYDSVLDRIYEETGHAAEDDLPKIEYLDGKYARLHLKSMEDGISPRTIGRLFMISSERTEDGDKRLENELGAFIALPGEAELPFSADELKMAAAEWKEKGFCPVHHSERFRKAHHPAYRVVKKDFIRLLPLLCGIDRLISEAGDKKIIVAIDGRCASGKTTVSEILERIYDCNVFHMDDFFLREEQRTPDRLSAPGENVDHERFLEEILLPLSRGDNIFFRRFNCHENCLEDPVSVKEKQLNIVEGGYSMHPSLSEFYDLTVFSDIGRDEQKIRIMKRNTAGMAEKFFSVWIPLEENYFNTFNIREQADIVLLQEIK